jgi:hypothetical protein
LGVRAEAPRCASHVPERQLLWGELHVHTGISMDAWMMDTRLRPDDAYRFARGEPVMLRPLDAKGLGTVPFRIQRPLDFAAVTDHARNFGGVRLCTTPGSLPYDTAACQRYRQPFSATSLDEGQADIFERAELLRSTAVCGQDMMRCRLAAGDAWQETITAAERHNEGAPGCGFTAFVAYEYTLTPEETKIHRNVIFRGATVPSLPISAIDEPTPLGLWRQLQRQCIDAGTGCDVLAIPHNSNLSNGQMFTIEYPPGSTPKQQAELARLRAEMEPVVEIMQMKGDSECRNGMWNVLGNDELCTFEKLRVQPDPPDCRDGTGKGALGQKGCVSRLDYARYALIEGLREADRLGVNPYAFGMTAATDIHTGTPAPVDEWAGEPASQMRAAPGMNPGGIAAIWAQENSRESIFAALRRREVYGTSGPRISARFFGGWSYPEDLCGSHDLVTRGYSAWCRCGFALWRVARP